MKCLFGQADDDSGTENPMDDSPIQKSLHIKTLLKFARQDYLLVTQAGYIAKAMFAIIRKRGHEVIIILTKAMGIDQWGFFVRLIKTHLDQAYC